MNVNLMRKVDHHIGIPLCFVSTILLKIFWKLSKSKTVAIKNILFIELSEMGSTILADPAMNKAKSQFNAKLFFVIFKKNKPSLDLLKTIPNENIFTIRESNIFLLIWDSLRFILWCRSNKIDTAIDLELFSRVSALLTGFSGAKTRVGFHNFHAEGLYRGDLLTHKVLYNPHQHIAKNFMALVYSLNTAQKEIPYSKVHISDEDIKLKQIKYSKNEHDAMHQTITKCYANYNPLKNNLILINPNASELLPQRRWAKENFIELIQCILQDFPQAIILITGSAAEKSEAEALCKIVANERCINFAGQLKLLQMPILYSIAKLMVTNDSGPGHFSAITPLNTFVLFGPETPDLYGSLGENSTAFYAALACSPCVNATNHRKTPCTQPVCMQAITVEEVYSKVKLKLTI